MIHLNSLHLWHRVSTFVLSTNEWQQIGIFRFSLCFTFRIKHPFTQPPPSHFVSPPFPAFYARINFCKWQHVWHIHFISTSVWLCVCWKQLQKIKQFFHNLYHPCVVFSWLNYGFFAIFTSHSRWKILIAVSLLWLELASLLFCISRKLFHISTNLKQRNSWTWFKFENIFPEWKMFFNSILTLNRYVRVEDYSISYVCVWVGFVNDLRYDVDKYSMANKHKHTILKSLGSKSRFTFGNMSFEILVLYWIIWMLDIFVKKFKILSPLSWERWKCPIQPMQYVNE